MGLTKIEWTATIRPDGTIEPGFTFNPFRGCTKVSAGCANCYAETLSKRNPKTLGVWGPKGTRVVAAESMWKEPLKWDRKAKELGVRYRVFCASLADVFEDWQGAMVDSDGVDICICHECGEWMSFVQQGCREGCEAQRLPRRLTMQDVRVRLFKLIDATPNLDWLVLTKRPENITRMMPEYHPCGRNGCEVLHIRPNVWLGTSVEDQAAADERIPHLLQVPAAVRFLSMEPLLGEVSLSGWFDPIGSSCGAEAEVQCGCKGCQRVREFPYDENGFAQLDWVIVGAESGPGARRVRVNWVSSIIDQCKAASVPVFVKQLGEFPLHEDGRKLGAYDAEEGYFPRCAHCGHFDFCPCPDGSLLCNGCDAPWGGLKDKKGGDPDEWPMSLRVREFPEVSK